MPPQLSVSQAAVLYCTILIHRCTVVKDKKEVYEENMERGSFEVTTAKRKKKKKWRKVVFGFCFMSIHFRMGISSYLFPYCSITF